MDETLATKASKVEFFEMREELMLVETKSEAKKLQINLDVKMGAFKKEIG